MTWERSSQRALVAIRWVLITTFAAVIISDLTECRPTQNYWQVLPDPGGACRQGYAHLITMAACNILTDLLLVFFPIPIILKSQMKIKRKVQLTLLFSLSLSVVGVTLYRVPHIVEAHGRQQTRSVLASVELIFATGSANALVLGSFVRDRGVKKQKFRRASVAESFDRSSGNRRPTLHRQWGSDEDLVRDVGMGVNPDLQKRPDQAASTPAPIVQSVSDDIARWQFPQRQRSNAERSDDSLLSRDPLSRHEGLVTPSRKVSFFDVGGLLEDGVIANDGSNRRESHSSSPDTAQSFSQPSPAVPASSGGFRRGSNALLQDLGGLLGPLGGKGNRPQRGKLRQGTELQTIPQSQHEQTFNMHGKPDPILRDPGGLLH